MVSERKCVLIDGNSLLYRAFYAIPFLSTRDGQPTNALFGFANMLLKLLSEEKPDSVIVAFDAPAKTFRHESFAEYKGTRKPTPEPLVQQADLARDLARSLGLVVLEVPGFEADDIVGTCARQFEADGYDVLIVTGDLDELQLVSGRVNVATTTKGVSELVIYTPQAVEERFGITPEQFVDYKALKGDTSDNIPGVPGVGDKTASRLIAQYGSVDGLLEHLADLPPGKLQETLKASVDQIRASRELSTIVCDVPLEGDLTSGHIHARPPGEAEKLFRALEFQGLVKRLPPSGEPSAREPGAGEANAAEVRRVNSKDELTGVLSQLEGAPCVTFLLDTDARGLLAGISFCVDGVGVYTGIETVSSGQGGLAGLGDGPYSASLSDFKDLFSSVDRPKATHDVKSAQRVLATQGVELRGCVDDTMLAGFLLQPGRGSYSLDWLVSQHLGVDIPDTLTGWQRAAALACLLARLRDHLRLRIDEQGLGRVYDEIELPLAPVLARMELAGVQLDPRYLDQLSVRLAGEIAALEKEIHALAGFEFNIGSTKQLGAVLFDKLQLPYGKKTKTGYSTDAETLEFLAPAHEIAGKILQWRELTKLKGTYADALPKLADPKTHRVHTSFNQTGAATGRLSSSDPNLQNIPVKSEAGREIRAAFVSVPGHVLLSADYSQIELRLLAHFSGDEELTRCFREREDIHTRTACALFGVNLGEVTEEMRRRAKTINFSVIYGKTDFGLSKDLGIAVGEAHEYIEAYFRQYPRVRLYTQEVLERARSDGYVTTLFGRKRWFPELHAGDRNVRANAERAAFNAPLQGTAADVIKLAMISLDALLVDMPATMVLQVHDELVFDVEQQSVEDVARVVKREMELECSLSVPLVVEIKYGGNWRDTEKLSTF